MTTDISMTPSAEQRLWMHEATQLLQKAVSLEPADAMQTLDIAKARKTLAGLPSMTF